MSNNRRDFFKTLGTAAAGVAAVSPLMNATTASAALSKEVGPAFLHALALEEALAGTVREFDGGDAFSDVIKEPVDAFGVVRKHIGNVKYENITLSFGTNMTAPVYTWISNLLGRAPIMHDGAVLSADASGKFRSQLTFLNALLTEVVFPELDAAAKDPALLSLTLSPEITKIEEASIPTLDPRAEKSKPWSRNNFRVTIGAIDEEATKRVTKVEAITFKQPIVNDPIGETRDPETTVQPLDVGQIGLYVPEQFAQPFFDWHKSFVLMGDSSNEAETFVKIQYLSPRGEILFTLFFQGVGICRINRINENERKGRLVRIELYAETANFFVGDLPPA